MQFNKRFNLAGTVLGAGFLLAASGNANALGFQHGELDVSLETSITAGVAIRGEDADRELIGKANLADQVQVDSSAQGAFSVNGDDGNLAFRDQGDLFFSQFKLSSDLTVRLGDWGIFARGNYRYDPNIKSDELFDDFDYGPNRFRSNADKRRREEAAEDAAGNDGELFDLYLFGNFQIGDRNATLRIGRQVLNWGEATFIANGINSIIPIDARQARGPGAEVKEIFKPFGMVFGSLALTNNLSAEAFYQFDWEQTIPDPSGTFFSTLDVIGAGPADVQIGFGRCNENLNPGTCAFAAGGTNVPEDPTNTPQDGGQYGLRLNAFLPWLNSTDLSLYAVNYHSRLPLLSARNVATPGVAPSGAFFREYPEDIELYGLSFNSFSELLGAAVQGEYSYHKDQPIQVDDVELLLNALRLEDAGFPDNAITLDNFRNEQPTGPGGANPITSGFERLDYHQLDLSLLKRWGPNWTGANATNLLFEIAGQYVDDLPDPEELPFESAATFVPNQPVAAMLLGLPAQDRDGYADDFSWGYRLVLANTYNGVFDRFNLTPSIRFFHDVEGNSPSPISTFLEERKQFVVGLSGSYLDAWEAGLSYTFFWDSGETAASPIDPATQSGQVSSGYTNNVSEDRDFANLFIRYTF